MEKQHRTGKKYRKNPVRKKIFSEEKIHELH